MALLWLDMKIANWGVIVGGSFRHETFDGDIKIMRGEDLVEMTERNQEKLCISIYEEYQDDLNGNLIEYNSLEIKQKLYKLGGNACVIIIGKMEIGDPTKVRDLLASFCHQRHILNQEYACWTSNGQLFQLLTYMWPSVRRTLAPRTLLWDWRNY